MSDEIKATHLHEPELEDAVLGCLLRSPKSFERVAWLRGEDFYGVKGVVFESMRRLFEHDRWFDTPTLRADLTKHKQWGVTVNADLFVRVYESVATPVLLESYASELRQKSRGRQLIGIEALIRKMTTDRCSPDEIAAAVRHSLDAVMENAQANAAPAPVVVMEALEQAGRLAARDGSSGVLSSGVADFDRLCGGLYPGEMVVVAARPGVGKTAFALQVATYAALRERPVYIASLEMRRAELMLRALATKSKISGDKIRRGLDKDQFRVLQEAGRRISEESLLWIDDRPRMSVDDIRAECHRLANANGLSLIVVDYLARLQPLNRKAQRYEQIGEMTRDLKCLACELRVPLLLLAQLNREADGAVPSMKHLRESGDIEADADVIVLLHPLNEQVVQVRVEKNRNGKCAALELQWNAELTEFWCLSNHAWADEPPPKLKHLPAIG